MTAMSVRERVCVCVSQCNFLRWPARLLGRSLARCDLVVVATATAAAAAVGWLVQLKRLCCVLCARLT